MIQQLGRAYFGGAVGALVASLALWIAGRAELTAAMGVSIAPALTWSWLSPRLVWGSIWGLALPSALRRGLTPVKTGLLLSLAPSLVELLWLLPERNLGMLGLELGTFAPLVILAANALWGWTLARVFVASG